MAILVRGGGLPGHLPANLGDGFKDFLCSPLLPREMIQYVQPPMSKPGLRHVDLANAVGSSEGVANPSDSSSSCAGEELTLTHRGGGGNNIQSRLLLVLLKFNINTQNDATSPPYEAGEYIFQSIICWYLITYLSNVGGCNLTNRSGITCIFSRKNRKPKKF